MRLPKSDSFHEKFSQLFPFFFNEEKLVEPAIDIEGKIPNRGRLM